MTRHTNAAKDLAALLGAVLASTDPVVLRDVVRDDRIPRSVRRALSIEAAEAWRADVPWSTLTNIVDAASHLAKNTHDAELWAECAAVEAWVDAYGIGTNAEHAALAAATARAEAAEKLRQIAAAKIQELMILASDYGSYCNSAGIEGVVPQTFSEWLEQQSEVQP